MNLYLDPLTCAYMVSAVAGVGGYLVGTLFTVPRRARR